MSRFLTGGEHLTRLEKAISSITVKEQVTSTLSLRDIEAIEN